MTTKFLIRAWDAERRMRTIMLDGPAADDEDRFRDFIDAVWQTCVREGYRDVLWGTYDRLELPGNSCAEALRGADQPDTWEPRNYRRVYARKGPEKGAEHPILASMDYRVTPPRTTLVPVRGD